MVILIIHTGGLPEAWTAPEKTPLYLHARGGPPVSRRGQWGQSHWDAAPRVELVVRTDAIVAYTNQPTEITTGVLLTGYVPRRYLERKLEPEPFFLDPTASNQPAGG